ncbi:MAG: hypothetical protein KGI59_02885 [Patescibacteria group bacterium]|nr:hypothetical protein [Patescibacteria group bacterium]MDE2172876.1 hypothetical protein [Patescibacteria group bacterium]
MNKRRTTKKTSSIQKTHKREKTVVLCSSASFYEKAIEVQRELRAMGYNVAIPLTAGRMAKRGDFNVDKVKTWYDDPSLYTKKKFLTKHHFKKIEKGDIVLVLNYEKNGRPGYIGGAVLAEMAIGLHFNKPIAILNPIDETVGYKEEILGTLPLILHGDLSRLADAF